LDTRGGCKTLSLTKHIATKMPLERSRAGHMLRGSSLLSGSTTVRGTWPRPRKSGPSFFLPSWLLALLLGFSLCTAVNFTLQLLQ